MDPGATEVLEKPIMKDPDKMIEVRDTVREIYYPKQVKELAMGKLPKNEQELREGLDKQLHDLATRTEPEDKEDEQGRKVVPDIALRHLDEEGWRKLGWEKRDREAIIHTLKNVFNIGETQAENMLHMLVAAGKTRTDVESILNEEAAKDARARFNFTDEDDQQALKGEAEHTGRFGGDYIRRASKFVYIQRKLDIENEDYIKRFVLDKDYAAELQYEYDNELPKNLFDLAWNIGHAEKNEFGIEGKFPILQMQVEQYKDENGKDKVRGRYVVNQGNFMRWMREQIWNWFNEFDTDELTDYFSKIELHKGPYTSVHLVTMLFDKNRYFRDETGHMWTRLYDQTLLEPWMMYTIRAYYLEYEKAMVSEEKLAEAYNNVFFLSKLTRKVYGKSMVNMLTTLPVDFEGKDSDTKLGESWMKMYLAYYHMADFEELQRVLGGKSQFFTREGWMKAIEEVNGSIVKQVGVPELGTFLGDREGTFTKAFTDEDGNVHNEIQNKKAFTDFINIYTSPVTPSTHVDVVTQALKDAVEHQIISKEGNQASEDVEDDDIVDKKYIKDDISLKYAWLMARTWTLFTGTAAKNNFPAVSGHNAETKWLYPEAYRRKYATYGSAGNPYTIAMFKQLGVPLLEGITVENADEAYEVYDEEEGKLVTKKRKLTPMEIIKQMHESSEYWESQRAMWREEMAKTTNEERKKEIQDEIDKIDEYSKNEYKVTAGQLEFNENVMRNYAQNIIGRAKVVYEQVMGGHEIDFDKFTKYDGIFRGVSFDRAEFQKAVQGGLITPLRYLFEANGATQFNMMVRAPVYMGKDKKGKPTWEFRDMALGEAMLGHQILDIAEFRKTRKDVTPEEWKELKKLGYKMNGKYLVRPDGKNEIDYNKVQENKTLVYKQWMLMKLGADLWTHISLHSTDPAYSMQHYMNVLDAIASLSGDFEGSDTDMRGARITKAFFSKEQMKWLKDLSKTNTSQLFTREFFKDLFLGDPRKQEGKFGESASIIVGAIFKGY